MIRYGILLILGIHALSFGEPTPASTNSIPPSNATSISIQEILISGPPQLKMYALSMISQGKIKGGIDETYLPGLISCADGPSAPLKCVSVRLLGENFIQDIESPNPEVVAALQELSNDESPDVRFNAIYYGLARIKNVTPDLAEQLIEIAAKERTPALQESIVAALTNHTPLVIEILNSKLATENSVAYFELYETFTGEKPPNADKYLDMPSSRPHLIVIKPEGNDIETARSALLAELKKAGLKNPNVNISGTDNMHVLLLTTYITRDYQNAELLLSNHEQFSIMQDLWLTPELEIQIEEMKKSK